MTVIMEIVFMFIHYTVAGPSTEGVIMLLPIKAGGAGTYEISIPVSLYKRRSPTCTGDCGGHIVIIDAAVKKCKYMLSSTATLF